ncbi:MAG: sulfite exporter TauE/SafE family protein [Acidobacteria bacterium]|nr:sulfite exporter TauE/SafE family protein [Acidobacteriota bacterium]
MTWLPQLAPWQWAVGLVCAFSVGVSKTGVPGLGILVVPLMVLAVGDARQSAGWLLPVLCTADLFAVWYWRKNTAAKRMFSLAPWVLAGMGLGTAALSLSERALRPMVGIIVLAMLALYVRRRLRAHQVEVPVYGAPYGVAAGFATTVANAAGPVMSLYLLSKRLSKADFVATGAWFFFVINLTKIPIYTAHGLIGRYSLAFDAAMAPAVLAGALAGRWLVYRIPQKLFETLVVGLTALSTLMLFK